MGKKEKDNITNSNPKNNDAIDAAVAALIPATRDTFVHFLFGTPGNEPILLHLLNAIFECDGQPFSK
jgi:hypothetical protein